MSVANILSKGRGSLGRAALHASLCVSLGAGLAVIAGGPVAAKPAAASAASPSAATGPVLGDTKMFGDWMVACDNGGSCRAIALAARDIAYEDGLEVHVTRAAAANAAAVLALAPLEAGGRDADSASLDVIVSGGGNGNVRLPVRYDVKERMWMVTLTPGLITTLRDGTQISMRAKQDGTVLSTASLAGFTASALYMDEQQGRAKGVTALLARGPRTAAQISKRFSVPSYRRALPSRAAPYTPSKVQWSHLARRSECEVPSSDTGGASGTATRLDATTTLLLVPCFSGAYNFASALYIAKQGAGGVAKLEPAPMDYMPDTVTRDAAVLVNASYDSKTGLLSHYNKGRGIGDCGDNAQWVWDGQEFRLVEAQAMDECRGTVDFLTVWRANVLPPAVK